MEITFGHRDEIIFNIVTAGGAFMFFLLAVLSWRRKKRDAIPNGKQRSRMEDREQALHRPGHQPGFSSSDFSAVPKKYRTLIPEYVKDYVSLNQFAA